jgi:hypothetical protein
MKNERGNAYLFVIAASLLILMLVTAALLVTVSSRRITAPYPDFAGLYDMAVAGNEQALIFLRERVGMPDFYSNHSFVNDITVTITPDGAPPFQETFHIRTTITWLSTENHFLTETRAYRPIDWQPGMGASGIEIPARVQAHIIKLDDDTLTMVNSMRITN